MQHPSQDLQFIKLPSNPPINQQIRFGLWVLGIFFGGFILWSLLFPIESAAIAPGKVTVDTNRKDIQHLEGGIVKRILVRENSAVKSGDLLMELEDTQPRATLDLLQAQAYELLGAEARLKAQRDQAKKIEFPKILIDNKNKPNVAKILQIQERLFISNTRTLEGQVSILTQRIGQLNKEIESLEAQVKSEDRQLALVQEEVTAVEYLEKKKLIEKPRLLLLKREQARLSGDRGEHLALISRAQQRIGETQSQIITTKDNNQRDLLNELRETQRQLTDVLEKQKAAQDVLNRTRIYAPQDGRVVGLQEHTIGGVLRPGADIMHIIPTKDRLVIEARISPLDIDVVHEGLRAKVRFNAFKQRSTPTLEGSVEYVSADSFDDQRTGASFYTARISVDATQMSRLHGLKLAPGMPAEVMIITGRRTPFTYITTPLIESFGRAFREQ